MQHYNMSVKKSVFGLDHMTIEKSFSVLVVCVPLLVYSGCVAEFTKRLQGAASFTKVQTLAT